MFGDLEIILVLKRYCIFLEQHDTSKCSDGSGGNYIMFPKATSGTDSNNRKFSDCSKGYVSPVIETKGQGSNGCFKGWCE